MSGGLCDACGEPFGYEIKGKRVCALCEVATPPGRVVFPCDAEAEVIADALLDLPVETRRALYLLITQEFADTFNGAAQAKSVKKHPWPPKPRRPQ